MTPRSKRVGAAVLAASAIAIPAEGIRQFAYYDPVGVLTVCYGSTTDVAKGKKYSMQECMQRLDEDMLHAVLIVERCHPGLPPNVLASFGDAVYNLGPKVACGPNSTAARHLAAHRYTEACNQLPRWNRANVLGVSTPLPGLTTRRERERQVCLGGSFV
jgi:lysozyme